MKEETKELVEWIKKHINTLNESGIVAMTTITNSIDMYDKAIQFLDSLPEIESHLCMGGYIQDNFEKPCRAGDKIKDKKGTGVLYWSKMDFRFYIRRDSGYLDLILCPFIRVE